ncbi:cytochrome P450 [Favolaschia claudopus]|uniref:Cytochrome P450 n=1 Tax=Favolaschia claudopus TaxID=2862362 RepID=A0AAV9Z2Q7_9AGAR
MGDKSEAGPRDIRINNSAPTSLFPTMQSTTIALSLGALSFILLRTIFRKAKGSLPPGPPGLPLIGNVLDMPSTMEWLKFADWGAKWGDICSVSLFGQPIVILNSATIIQDLNENTAAFSTRPRLPMAGELVGYDQTLVLIPYGPRFRTYRKYFANQIGSLGGVQQVIMETEIHRFLKRLLLNPGADAISNHLRKLTGAIILRITYGIEVQEHRKSKQQLQCRYSARKVYFLMAIVTGSAFLVDVFPAMLRIPEILAPFKQTARIWARETKDMVEAPYHFVRQQMTSGTAPISFVSSLLKEEEKLSEEDLRDIKFTAASFYGGGADTSAAAMQAFFLAMVLAPEVQREAQTEIDSVVGTTRLPLFSDREQLPYVSAVVTELLRWHSVAPLGEWRDLRPDVVGMLIQRDDSFNRHLHLGSIEDHTVFESEVVGAILALSSTPSHPSPTSTVSSSVSIIKAPSVPSNTLYNNRPNTFSLLST